MSQRQTALFVYLEPADRKKLAQAAARAAGKARRPITVSEYVREALRFADEHKSELFERLRRA